MSPDKEWHIASHGSSGADLHAHVKYGSDGIKFQCIFRTRTQCAISALNARWPANPLPSPHRLVSRRSPPFRSSCPACRRADRRAGDLPLCLRRGQRCANARPLGGAARWWLAQSLRALQAGLNAIGSSLVLRKGPAAKIIAELARETEAAAVFWNEIAQAPHQAVADQVAAALQEIGVTSQSFPGDLLAAPPPSATRKDGVCGCSRRSGGGCRRRAIRRQPLPAPKRLRPGPTLRATGSKAGASNRRIRIGPADCARAGCPGEISAQARLDAFLEDGVAGYAIDRDRPDRDGTSRLSPHLRFGEISPRQVWHAARFAAAERLALPAISTNS